MIQVLIKSKNLPLEKTEKTNKIQKDTIIIQKSTIQEIDEQGSIIIKNKYKKINLTKKINESAKLVKQSSINTAEEKLAELNKILSK